VDAPDISEFEESVKKILDVYTSADPVGRWIRSIPGLGPYIAAGLLALIEIEKAPTVGHIWRFAGLDPTMKWSPGQKDRSTLD
jgi:Transposase IS116/IS110/IS902 family.